MTVLHIDASVGSAGDMILAALIDAGADEQLILGSIASVLPGARVTFDQVSRSGLRACRARVDPPDTSPHRQWRDLREAISRAGLFDDVATGALRVFGRLAEAEGRVHGVPSDQVHFHEVGAWDSVCDIVGAVAGIVSLRPDRITGSPVATGSGLVQTDHGTMPVPAPAVAELLAAANAPTCPGPAAFEACTPTAAALLTHFVTDWQPGPSMRVTTVGVGAGSADPGGFANVTRVFAGEALSGDGALPTSTAVVLETNVDDLDPRLWPGIQRDLLAAGASDAWVTAIQMKKGRPAMTLSVLCPASTHRELAGAVMRLTTAIGMRVVPVGKIAAERRITTVAVGGHPVRVKVATWQGRTVNVQPEWEDVAVAAEALGQPQKVVLARAHAEASTLWDTLLNP